MKPWRVMGEISYSDLVFNSKFERNDLLSWNVLVNLVKGWFIKFLTTQGSIWGWVKKIKCRWHQYRLCFVVDLVLVEGSRGGFLVVLSITTIWSLCIQQSSPFLSNIFVGFGGFEEYIQIWMEFVGAMWRYFGVFGWEGSARSLWDI